MITREKYLEIRKKLPAPNPWARFTLHLTEDFALLGVIYLLVQSSFSFLAAPLVSIFMFRSFSVMHDAVHGCLLKNRRLNRIFGVLYGSFCLLPYEQWRAVHLDHHLWSGNIEKDSVMALVRMYPHMPPWQKMVLNSLWKAWMPLLGFLQHVVFWTVCSKKLFGKNKNLGDLVSFVAPLILVSALLVLAPISFTLVTLPLSLFLFFLAIEIVNFPHHLELPHFTGETRFTAANQYQTARSCVYPKWFARKIVLNFNFHVEHHMYPDQPWYLLPEIQTLIKAELKQAYNQDPSFEWILRNRGKDLALVLDYMKSSETAA